MTHSTTPAVSDASASEPGPPAPPDDCPPRAAELARRAVSLARLPLMAPTLRTTLAHLYDTGHDEAIRWTLVQILLRSDPFPLEPSVAVDILGDVGVTRLSPAEAAAAYTRWVASADDGHGARRVRQSRTRVLQGLADRISPHVWLGVPLDHLVRQTGVEALISRRIGGRAAEVAEVLWPDWTGTLGELLETSQTLAEASPAALAQARDAQRAARDGAPGNPRFVTFHA